MAIDSDQNIAGSAELELPLRGNCGDDATNDASSSTSKESSGHEVVDVPEFQPRDLAQGAIDLIISFVFWYVLLFLNIPDLSVTVHIDVSNYIPVPNYTMILATEHVLFLILVTIMTLWRMRPPIHADYDLPYTCGHVYSSGKEVFIVATLHISPRAPRDVQAVIMNTEPDVVMIELDEERLDRMRHDDVERAQHPKREDLQPIHIIGDNAGSETLTVYAQRAVWNAERAGEVISGVLAFDEEDAFGLQSAWRQDVSGGRLSVVHRGSPNGEYAPFALKAHKAAHAGAEALLVINQDDALPMNRVGGGNLLADLRIALHSWSCGFPPIPVLLLGNKDGMMLKSICRARPEAQAEFEVLADTYPRRALRNPRKRLCQACALMCTGIGVLYGIIQCFNVEVGAEFVAAEEAALARNTPCVCIDVDMNMFWSRLGWAVLPTPCNIVYSALAWVAFPRVLLRVLFPGRGSVDVIGGMFLHAASFSFRTWVAFGLAGFCSSFILNHILELFGYGAEKAAEGAGVVKEKDAEYVQTWIMLGIELYLLPRIYQAVAASRDEAMFQMIVAKGRSAQKLVVVVGAAHSNGILSRIRTRGL